MCHDYFLFCFLIVDPNTESQESSIEGLGVYVPRDEQFSDEKFSQFVGYGLKSVFQYVVQDISDVSGLIRNEFDSFNDVSEIYSGGIKLPKCNLVKRLYDNIPLNFLNEILPNDGEGLFKFPTPQVIQGPQILIIFCYMYCNALSMNM